MSKKKKRVAEATSKVVDTTTKEQPTIPEFDFLFALRTEQHDTKPNMSKLLKKYVSQIRISTK